MDTHQLDQKVQKAIQDYKDIIDTVLEKVGKYPAKFGVPVVYINPMGTVDKIGLTIRANGIPYFRYPDQAVRAMHHYVEYGIFRNSHQSTN